MKKHVTITIFLVFVLAILACSNDDAQDNKLLGTWELIRYENNIDGSTITPPVSAKPIFITFMESEFKGKTGINTFFGVYSVISKKIIFENFNGSEAGEPKWGQMFYNSIGATYCNNKLVLQHKYFVYLVRINKIL